MRTKRIRSEPCRSSRDGSRLNADAGLQRLRRPSCRAAAAMSDQSSASMSVVIAHSGHALELLVPHRHVNGTVGRLVTRQLRFAPAAALLGIPAKHVPGLLRR